jgi:hypothetical protein
VPRHKRSDGVSKVYSEIGSFDARQSFGPVEQSFEAADCGREPHISLMGNEQWSGDGRNDGDRNHRHRELQNRKSSFSHHLDLHATLKVQVLCQARPFSLEFPQSSSGKPF